ncbi:MAG: DUF342 domain-containing protein [Gammaproteobacteria bacterium]|nr:DUF342 domain-containing protein [Gammaproteobacteria bacterium]
MSNEVSFINNDNTIDMVVPCHALTELVDEKIIADWFATSDFSDCYLHKERLTECVEELNLLIEKVQDEVEEPQDFTFAIAQIRDANVSVSISRDKMTAKLTVEAPWQGQHANVDLVIEECKKAGVVFGVKRSKVEGVLDRSFSGEPGEVFEEVVAFGKQPKNGKNAYFKPLVELFSDKIRKPNELEDGKVDLKDLGTIETVKPGEKIYQKIPFTFGINGYNVLGETIKAAPGKDAKLETSSGTIIDPDDKNVLLAKREGLARIIESRMEVDDVYTLMELTPKQGHIKFNGSVVILGDVLPEMKIVATGDVLIGGFVESASIRCKGELTVLSGVSGKPLDEPEGKRKNNCLLESSYRVNISFANHVDIFAKRDVFVHRQISHCNVTAASMVVGKGPVPRGKVIGGSYFLSKSLEAGYIGAPSDTDTNISMNRTYEVFKEKEQHFWSIVEGLQEKLDSWNAKLATVHQEEKQAAIKFEIMQLEQQIAKNNSYRKSLAKRRREYMSGVYVRAYNTIYGGLQFVFGSKGLVNEAEKGPSVVILDEYTLKVEPYVG